MLRALLLGLLLLPASVAAADAVEPTVVDTKLYLHMLNVQAMPINTQEPDPAFIDLTGWGTFATSTTCLQRAAGDPDASQGMLGQSWHRYYGYSTPTFVLYDFAQNGNPMTHPERGLSMDIPLEGNAVLHWGMRATNGVEGAGAPGLPTANVRVQAVLRTSDNISIEDKAYDTGEVLYEGSTSPVTLAQGIVAGSGANQVTAETVGGDQVYTFHVPLLRLAENLSSAHGFTLRIDVTMDVPGCDPDTSLMTNSLQPYADPKHWPFIELRHGTPLQVDATTLDELGEGLLLNWTVRSAWGGYDVDAANATLRIFGPANVTTELVQLVQRTREHAHLTEPVRFTWALFDGVPDGTYTVLLEVPNLQHTATASTALTFTVQDGRIVDTLQQAPGPGAGLLLLALAALALVARRQKVD